MRRSRIFEMMTFVDHQALVRRQHGRVLPVLRLTPHGDVREQQVVIHHHYVGCRRLLPRLEQKTLIVKRALHAPAQIRLGRHLIPHIRARRRGQVGQRAVLRFLRPLSDLLHVAGAAVIEQCGASSPRLLQALETEIVAPSLQQREAHFLIGERALEEGQIFRHQLLLQRDRVRRHDGAFAIGRGPS